MCGREAGEGERVNVWERERQSGGVREGERVFCSNGEYWGLDT